VFFIQILGRRERREEASDLDELGEKVAAAMEDNATNMIVVSVGKTDEAVMPYVWLQRDLDTDEWEGELGDSIKLGIEDGLVKEHDPIRMLGLSSMTRGELDPVEEEPMRFGRAKSKAAPTKPKKVKKKPSEKTLEKQAKKMIDDLFKNLHEPD